MNISSLADCRKEFRVNGDGIVVASMRGVARICDVNASSLTRSLQDTLKPSKLGKMLKDKGFEPAELLKNGFSDLAVAIVVEYYAFEAGHYCTEQAKAFYRTFANIGIRAFFKEWLGEDVKKNNLLGSFFKDGVTSKGNVWRIFWLKNMRNKVSTMIPVVYVNGSWFVQCRAIMTAYDLRCSLGVDLTIDLDEFDWMFLGLPMERNGNFCSPERVKNLMGNDNAFSVWADSLNVFAIPEKVEVKAIEEEIVDVDFSDINKPTLSLPPVNELNMFHNIAMRLINEVHKANVANVDLKGSVLEVAFDVLKFAHVGGKFNG